MIIIIMRNKFNNDLSFFVSYKVIMMLMGKREKLLGIQLILVLSYARPVGLAAAGLLVSSRYGKNSCLLAAPR